MTESSSAAVGGRDKEMHRGRKGAGGSMQFGNASFDCGGGSLVDIFVKTHQSVCLKLARFSHENCSSI